MIIVTAASQSDEIAKRMPERPKQSASAVTALGATARNGKPRGAWRSGRLIDLPSLRDAGRCARTRPAQNRLARDAALAKRDLRRDVVGQIHIHPATKADQA